MRRFPRIALMTVAMFVVPAPGFAVNEVSVAEVIEEAAQLADERVSVRGELVGDYGNRRDGWTWSQINGDVYVDDPIREGGAPRGANVGLGVRIPTELMMGLGPPGGYRDRGPVVRVTGVWKHHDPARQGESYLQVESLIVLESARRFDGQVDLAAALAGTLLLAAAAAIGLPIARGRDRP